MKEIAILGAGVGGLTLLNEFKLHHQDYHCTVFERKENVGGVWATHLTNKIELQIEPRIYRFPNNPSYPSSKSGADIHLYLNNYLKEKGLLSDIYFAREVIDIIRNGDTQSFTLVVYDRKRGFSEKMGPFHFIISTGTVTQPNIPELFKQVNLTNMVPKVIHTSQLTKTMISEIKGKDIVVYGGSKSSAEAILALSPSNRLRWVARRFYSFARETPTTTISLEKAGRCLIQSNITKFMECLTEFRVHEDEDAFPGSFNFLTETEYRHLRYKTPTYRETIIKLVDRAVVLSNGQRLGCDWVILGTGYRDTKPPTEIVDNRIISLKPEITTSICYASHFCGYSILVGKLKQYLDQDRYLEGNFYEYLGENRLKDYLYQLDYYLGFSIFPSRKIDGYTLYSPYKSGLIKIVVIMVIIVIILVQLVIVSLIRITVS
jgi:hypothetical protein